MAAWLQRPQRDDWVDLRSSYRSCGGDRGCQIIPVPDRVRTDFLWQRSPFLLYGGGSGTIEGPGIDFILPYWMGRWHGLTFEEDAGKEKPLAKKSHFRPCGGTGSGC
jgi:hypothetical protein